MRIDGIITNVVKAVNYKCSEIIGSPAGVSLPAGARAGNDGVLALYRSEGFNGLRRADGKLTRNEAFAALRLCLAKNTTNGLTKRYRALSPCGSPYFRLCLPSIVASAALH